MTRNRWLAGAVAGVVLGAGGVFAVTAATEPADAQSGFQVTPAQLKTNQKISQAAVRRSNQSLNYLAPIRTAASDNADTGRKGVTPLSQIPGSGKGWGTDYIGDTAVTMSKLSETVQGRQAKWVTKVNNGANTDMRASATTYAMTRSGVGDYRVNYGMDLSACTWSAVPGGDGVEPSAYYMKVYRDPGNTQQLVVKTYNTGAVAVDSGYEVQVYC